MQNQLVVSVGELRFVTLACRHCHTRVELDLEAEFEAPRSAFRAPRECPRCQNPFDSAIPPAVESLQKIYRALAGQGNAVTFAVADHDRAV